jgi:transcriptional regulator with XRE-family HTH domain
MDENALKQQIGLKVRQLRTIKGWSRQQAADKLEMSVAGYGSVERGETDMCITRLAQIAEVFEINLIALLGLDEKTIFNFIKTSKCSIGVNPISNDASDINLKHELEKSQLIQQSQTIEIENLKQQIIQLQEINNLLKQNLVVINKR